MLISSAHNDRGVVKILGTAAFFVVYFASRPERRRLLGALQLGGALSADTAMTTYQLGAEQSRVMARLVRDGLVATTADGRFYIGDSDRIQKSNRVTTALVIAAILGLAGVAGLGWLAIR